MTNEIMLPTGDQLPAYLRQAATDNAEFSAGVAAGALLPFLSVRGKEFRLRWQGQERNLRTRDLEVVFVASRANISKRFYATQYSIGSIEAPDCFSTHGARPDPGAGTPQAQACAACPQNQFGSKITASGKQGKACNDYKRIVVLPIINGQPIDTPVVLDVPAMSLKSPKGYQGQDMFLREYFAILSKHGLPATGVVTRLGFTDAEYPQLCFSYARPADEALFNKVQELRQSDEVQEVLESEMAAPAGPITPDAMETRPVRMPEAAPQPGPQVAPAPAVAQQPTPAQPAAADIMGDVTAFLQRKAAPAEAKAPTPSMFEAQPEAPAPQPAAKPAASGDLLADVEALLGGL